MQIQTLLEKNDPETDWQALVKHYYRQIQFLQHEREIHLLVTLAVALFTLIVFAVTIAAQSWQLFLVDLLFLGLLVPYLFHYRKLENGVQSLYKPYEELSLKAITSVKK